MNFKNPDTAAISEKKLYIFDMDGTIYLGGNVFDFAIKFINESNVVSASCFIKPWKNIKNVRVRAAKLSVNVIIALIERY